MGGISLRIDDAGDIGSFMGDELAFNTRRVSCHKLVWWRARILDVPGVANPWEEVLIWDTWSLICNRSDVMSSSV